VTIRDWLAGHTFISEFVRRLLMGPNIEQMKLIVSFITPVVVLIIGIWVKKAATDYERRASLNDKIIAKRVAIYDEIGKDLNDIFAYVVQVGQWKDFTPDVIVNKKRSVDKIMYMNRPYWSTAAFNAYKDFIQACFHTFNGIGEDAKIRAATIQYEQLPTWKEEWKSKWFHPDLSPCDEIFEKNDQLMKCLSNEFGYLQNESC
jgi:hypothetical protein